ncbi:MAG: InlB B-repeat-containing protein [Verrucomicrobiales bacterium]
MVSGPSTVFFWWKASCRTGIDELRCELDGALAHGSAPLTGETGWSHAAAAVPDGTHILRWTYRKGVGVPGTGEDRAWVDQVTIGPPSYTTDIEIVGAGSVQANPPGPLFPAGGVTYVAPVAADGSYFAGWAGAATGSGSPLAVTLPQAQRLYAVFSLPLAPALDAPSLTVTAGGEVPYFALPGLGRGGLTSGVRSGLITESGQTSWLEARLTAPGTLSFWSRFLFPSQLTVDGAPADLDSDPADGDNWVRNYLSLPGNGLRVVRWTTTSPLQGRGQLDGFSYAPVTYRLNLLGPVFLWPAGSAPGEGVYEPGTPVTLIATPPPDEEFAGWFHAVTSQLVSSENPWTLTMDGSKNLVAGTIPSLSAALTARALPIATNGDALWTPSGLGANAELIAKGTSRLETELPGAGTLSFTWAHLVGAAGDSSLRVLINGQAPAPGAVTNGAATVLTESTALTPVVLTLTGPATLSWVLAGANGAQGHVQEVSFTPSNGYPQWANTHGLAGAAAAPLADAEGDGSANFFEFATGTDPGTPTVAPTGQPRIDANGRLTLTLPFAPGSTPYGFALSAEASPDLLNWVRLPSTGITRHGSEATILSPLDTPVQYLRWSVEWLLP